MFPSHDHSNQYNLINHNDIFNATKEALNNLGLETQTKIRDAGDKFYADIVFKDKKQDYGKGEVMGAGFRMINSYNKTTGVVLQPFLVRLQCTNGMVMHEVIKGGLSVPHNSKELKEFIKNMEKGISLMIKSLADANEKIRNIIEEAMIDSIEWELLDKILSNLSINDKHKKNIYTYRS